MADGMGDDGTGAPTLARLKQFAWDLSYIRDKCDLDGVSKTFIWRKAGSHEMTLGKIQFTNWNPLDGLRSMANRIQQGQDGPAPPVTDFGQSGWSASTLEGMYNHFATISAKIMMGKRTFTMRMEGSTVEMAIGDISAGSAYYRLALKSLAEQIEDGRG